jgi:hypothetical protein
VRAARSQRKRGLHLGERGRAASHLCANSPNIALKSISNLGSIALATAAALVASAPSHLHASVAIAVGFDALLAGSAAVGAVTPIARRAVWEDNRIYTYTEVRVDRAVAGEITVGQTLWVRTMGGVVGRIGQRVEGEAVLLPGRPSLVFLHEGPQAVFEVTARGQGQFPIVADETGNLTRIVRSLAMGAIVAPRPSLPPAPGGLAGDVLHGRDLDDAAAQVSAAWARTHAR